MSVFTRDQVMQVAHLSRLAFTEAEAEAFAGQLTRILEHVDTLAQLDTEGVEPTTHAMRQVNVMREDVPAASLSNADALANAPEREQGCFKVPPIIQES